MPISDLIYQNSQHIIQSHLLSQTNSIVLFFVFFLFDYPYLLLSCRVVSSFRFLWRLVAVKNNREEKKKTRKYENSRRQDLNGSPLIGEGEMKAQSIKLIITLSIDFLVLLEISQEMYHNDTGII